MKKIFTLILILAFGFVAFSQQNMQDVVYLKNGSVIRGIIIEQIPNQSIKIQTADNSIFVYKIDEIEKMTKESAPAPAKIKSKSGSPEEFKKGFSFGMKVGINISNWSNLEDINIEDYIMENVSKTGLQLGFIGEMGFNKYLALQFELLYAQKGFKYKGNVLGQDIKVWETIGYLEIPVLVKASYPFGKVKIYGDLGPYLGIGITSKLGSDPDTDSESPKFEEGGLSRIDFGLCFGAGAGYKIGNGEIFLDLRYGLGLLDGNNIADDDKPDGYKKNCNRNFGIAIGYLARLGK